MSRKRTWIVWGSVVLPLVAILSLPFWAGKWYWRSVQRELAAKGEKLFAEDFKRPAIPESDNYFAIPFFKESIATKNGPSSVAARLKEEWGKARTERNFLKEGGGGAPTADKVAKPVSLELYSRGLPVDATVEEKRAEVLRWLEKELEPWEPLRRELLAECGRPSSDSSMDLSKGVLADISFTSAVISAVQITHCHAIAALAKGDTHSAFEDILIIRRMALAIGGEPLLITSLVANASRFVADRIVRDGMNLWSEEQLMNLDAELTQFTFDRKKLANILRTERAASNRTLTEIIEKGLSTPGGDVTTPLLQAFGHIPLANYNLAVQDWVDYLEGASFRPADLDALVRRYSSMGEVERFFHIFEKSAVEGFSSSLRRHLRQDNQARLTRVAIALERSCRKHGGTPAKLDDLVPEFIDQIPEGAIPGQKIHYLPGTNGGYRLWTNGWNETDEGGAAAAFSDDTKDWVLEKDPALAPSI